MKKESPYIVWLDKLTIDDVPKVGGKNASLGEMIQNLSDLGVKVPGGFATTTKAYNHFLEAAGLSEKIDEIVESIDTRNIKDLREKGKQIREMIVGAELPEDLDQEIRNAYVGMEEEYGENTDVAVRSSATAEDLPGASFAGQQETYLNVVGSDDVIESTKKCIASLFTDRAISYRHDKGFDSEDISLSVGVQKMVRSDIASSGVMFSIDTETGFDKVVVINASYGLGEMVVQGKVTPDEYMVFKPTIDEKHDSIINKSLGDKETKMIYGEKGGEIIEVPEDDRRKFVLNDEEIDLLAKWAIIIEKHFTEKHGKYTPMDMEWAKDGKSGELFIVQARPETVRATEDKNVIRSYKLKEVGQKVTEGTAVGTKIATGSAHVIKDVKQIDEFKEGEILITEVTDPDWEPIMKIAGAIVTDKGGRTSHAAIVSRELGIPCVVGTDDATENIKTGQMITVDCSSGDSGMIYDGKLSFDENIQTIENIPETKTKIMLNIGSPDEAFRNHSLPVSGVGLGRLEFIINSYIGIHPNALINFENLEKDDDKKDLIEKINEKTVGYENKKDFYTDKLAYGIAKIAASFWPGEVIIRFSDFKSNEYKSLLGGELYEPEESNPMIGWRGASRYYDPNFKEAFTLECKAVKKVREEMGLSNITVMIPFTRTVEEGEKVLEVMKESGLDPKKDDNFNVYVMAEIPSNIVLADRFLEIFDGMSIGSNDLTQLTLGMDRDSEKVSQISNENNEAVKRLIVDVIKKCKEKNKYVGICGQAPSDFPLFTEFLIENGIDSVSLSPDTVIKTIKLVAEAEEKSA